jgi:hypothetical protein
VRRAPGDTGNSFADDLSGCEEQAVQAVFVVKIEQQANAPVGGIKLFNEVHKFLVRAYFIGSIFLQLCKDINGRHIPGGPKRL